MTAISHFLVSKLFTRYGYGNINQLISIVNKHIYQYLERPITFNYVYDGDENEVVHAFNVVNIFCCRE